MFNKLAAYPHPETLYPKIWKPDTVLEPQKEIQCWEGGTVQEEDTGENTVDTMLYRVYRTGKLIQYNKNRRRYNTVNTGPYRRRYNTGDTGSWEGSYRRQYKRQYRGYRKLKEENVEFSARLEILYELSNTYIKTFRGQKASVSEDLDKFEEPVKNNIEEEEIIVESEEEVQGEEVTECLRNKAAINIPTNVIFLILGLARWISSQFKI